MGHFIYQLYASHDVEDEIGRAVERMVKEIGELDDEEIVLCENLLGNWVQEIFCDMFAICLVGPAFSFAFSQLVGASVLIGRPERLSVLVKRFFADEYGLREFFEAWRSFHPILVGDGERAGWPTPHGSSVRMSRGRLFLGGLVSTRARLRFTGWS
jgi:hypothetical protein